MKKYLSKRTLWQSVLSTAALGLFMLLAMGSFDTWLGFLYTVHSHKLEDGNWRNITSFDGIEVIVTGKQSEYGFWEGETTIEHISISTGEVLYKEVATMVHGK